MSCDYYSLCHSIESWPIIHHIINHIISYHERHAIMLSTLSMNITSTTSKQTNNAYMHQYPSTQCHSKQEYAPSNQSMHASILALFNVGIIYHHRPFNWMIIRGCNVIIHMAIIHASINHTTTPESHASVSWSTYVYTTIISFHYCRSPSLPPSRPFMYVTAPFLSLSPSVINRIPPSMVTQY